ncbi:hypothetical protein FB645_004313 [Coemansia sp. IMI 203386]|nr:hypothetical protein FB645_004313 [Coemansia sp. IMI 203386]
MGVYIALYLYICSNVNTSLILTNADLFEITSGIRRLRNGIFEIVNNLSSLRRVVQINSGLERKLRGDYVNTLPYMLTPDSIKPSDPIISINDCSFNWIKTEALLENVTFSAKQGELVGIVGKTGSGKSSLLEAMCGEMEMTKGTGHISGTVGYMMQTPWIMNDTLRANIVFGREFEKEFFWKVINACALTEDLRSWPDSDLTVIGDRGINISGGQRARVALARAVYSQSDIYILDDPLSAVDAHVKRHILDNVLLEKGLLGNKLRIIATHVETILPYCNQIVTVDAGSISVITQEAKTHEIKLQKSSHMAEPASAGSFSPDDPDCRPAAHWPEHGKIEFCDFSMRYRKDLEPALKNINLTIYPGEKIGIVGRTGAGKSSLVKALFRLVHGTTNGKILIDGQDISKFGVGDLRPRLGVIPQESTIFNGSFEENLDPLNQYTLEDMWSALIKCNAVDVVSPSQKRNAKNKLDGYDSEEEEFYARLKEENEKRAEQWNRSGWGMKLFLFLFEERPKKWVKRKAHKRPHGLQRNALYSSAGKFSNGQKQLFSFCRMLLHKRKVLILDEATAEIDLQTDEHIQTLIRDEFKDCTVLTIAHRLETIKNSDRIVVMDHGKIVEVGPPNELMEKGGFFAKLVESNDF